MTREEAIEVLQYEVQETISFCSDSKHVDDRSKKFLDAVGVAIETLKAHPCEDTISRKHLLSEIDALMQSPWFNNGKDDERFTHYGYVERKEAVEVVRDLCVKTEPSVTSRQNWIPVSERLPEIEEDCDVSDVVLATVEDRCNPEHRLYRYVIYADWDGELWRDENGHEFLNITDDEDTGVTAWMPLPEAYKGEGEKHE